MCLHIGCPGRRRTEAAAWRAGCPRPRWQPLPWNLQATSKHNTCNIQIINKTLNTTVNINVNNKPMKPSLCPSTQLEPRSYTPFFAAVKCPSGHPLHTQRSPCLGRGGASASITAGRQGFFYKHIRNCTTHSEP